MQIQDIIKARFYCAAVLRAAGVIAIIASFSPLLSWWAEGIRDFDLFYIPYYMPRIVSGVSLLVGGIVLTCFSRQVARWLVAMPDLQPRCPRCNYLLWPTGSMQCPECGLPLDPSIFEGFAAWGMSQPPMGPQWGQPPPAHPPAPLQGPPRTFTSAPRPLGTAPAAPPSSPPAPGQSPPPPGHVK